MLSPCAPAGSRPERAFTVTSINPVAGRTKRSGCPGSTAFMYSAQAGPAAVAPVRFSPRVSPRSSKPIHSAVAWRGVNPTVHASDQFWVVPVLPAVSVWKPPTVPEAQRNVPHCTVLCNRSVMTYATCGVMIWRSCWFAPCRTRTSFSTSRTIRPLRSMTYWIASGETDCPLLAKVA